MASLEGKAGRESFERPVNDGNKLTEKREKIARDIVQNSMEKTKEQKPLNPDYDNILIRNLNQIFSGSFIAKEAEEKAIMRLSWRINEIRSKIRNGQALTGGDRRFMNDISMISRNYKVKGLEIKWFKESKPLDKTKKGNLSKGEVVLSFQNLALAKAEKMILESRKIVREEKDRYLNSKNGAIDELYKILVCKNAPKIKTADRFRAKGLKKCVKNQSSSRLQFLKETDPVLITELPQIISLSEEKLTEYIFKYPPGKAENIAFRIEKRNELSASKLEKPDSIVDKPDKILEKYSDFASARLTESTAILKMKTADASNHPILNDVNTDFLGIARRFRDSQKGFKDEIIKILNNRESSANKTLEILYSTPSKVWELKPLIELTMTEEKIEKKDKYGKLIWERVKEVEKGNTIRNIGMLAMGIGLGVAGFFTGGSAWAGFALAAGGAVLSGIDLKYELDAYKLHSNAAKATLGSEFSDDPGVLGVSLAILSLVIDIGSLGKAAKVAINSSAKVIAASDDVARTAQEAEKLFDELKAAKKIENVSKDEFVKTIQEIKDGIQLPKNAGKEFKPSDKKIITAYKKTAVVAEKPVKKEVLKTSKQIAALENTANNAQESKKLYKELQMEKKVADVSKDELIKIDQEEKNGIELQKNDDIIKTQKTIEPVKNGTEQLNTTGRETATRVEKPVAVVEDSVKLSNCSPNDLYKYLKKIDSESAEIYLKTGKWPKDIRIPKDPSALTVDGYINWNEVPKGGYVLDANGNAIKEVYQPKVGEIIDRHGPPNGNYASPVIDGKPFNYDQRSLPYVEDMSMYHQYVIKGDFNNIKAYVDKCTDLKTKLKVKAFMERNELTYDDLIVYKGEIAKGFGSIGGGIQYELPLPISILESLGILEKIR